jgi:rRNA maturation endonuclease Nob1
MIKSFLINIPLRVNKCPLIRHSKRRILMDICKGCDSNFLEFKPSSTNFCDECGQFEDIVSINILDDEIDRMFYFELGGEG